MSSRAAVPAGSSKGSISLTQDSVTWSMNSRAVGARPEVRIRLTASAAAASVPNPAAKVWRAGGLATRLQGDPGDHPQSAFRAQKQAGEIIAHHPFHGPGPGSDELPGGQHHFQTQDIIPGDAVLHRHRPPGALGDVAADGAEIGAGRVRRIV